MTLKEIKAKPRRILKISHVLLIIFVILLMSYLLFRYKLKTQLDAKLVEIRSSGYPVTYEELDQWYSTPHSVDNAADVIIDAFSFYEKWEEDKLEALPVVGKAELPCRNEPFPEETEVLIVQYIADNSKALELLHKGARTEQSRYPVDYSEPLALNPYLSEIKAGIKLLQLEALIRAESNQPELALESIESMLGVSNSLSKEPCLISQLVSINYKGLVVRTVERILNRTEFTDAQLMRLDKMLFNVQNLSTMPRAFIGETCNLIETFRMPSFKMKECLVVDLYFPDISIICYKLSGLADMDMIIYLDLLSDYMKAYELPFHRRWEAFQRIDSRIGAVSDIHLLLNSVHYMSRSLTIDLRLAADLLTARTAIAICRYRLETGNYPEKLVNLVPDYFDAVLKDPFDGNDLRFQKNDIGFVVYSIGPDGIDNGGKEKNPADKSSSYDQPFRIE